MKFKMFSAVAMTSLTVAPAMAQEAAPYFTGPRAEARVGYDNVTIRATVSDGTDSFSRSEGRDGVTYGGELGYDYAINHLVLGGYVGLEGSSTKACGELYGQDQICLRAGRNITVGARVGYAFEGTTMIYAKGGYTNAQIKADYEDYELILPDFRESESVDAFHVGAGLEAGLPGGVYGRLEYVYTGAGETSVQIEDVSFGVKPHRHQAVFGLGVRF